MIVSLIWWEGRTLLHANNAYYHAQEDAAATKPCWYTEDITGEHETKKGCPHRFKQVDVTSQRTSSAPMSRAGTLIRLYWHYLSRQYKKPLITQEAFLCVLTFELLLTSSV